ncbi:MAG: hypothetical protein KGL39_55865 [Patescibacteria group bacterium]|nr:hypothetical protein [Patescibacteria group bacterium]
MSMERCERCSASIDTDIDLDCYVTVHGKTECVCEVCREKTDERTDWERRLLADIAKLQAASDRSVHRAGVISAWLIFAAIFLFVWFHGRP